MTGILIGWIMGVASIIALRRALRPLPPVPQLQLFREPPVPSAIPTPPPVPPELALAASIGQIVSDGMDRVESMRTFGADRFLTLMPMPDGTCWSLTVVRHDDETTARAYYQPVPAVTH